MDWCYSADRHPLGETILLDAVLKLAPVERTVQTGFKQNVHYLRGIAALSVLFFHASAFHETEYGSGIMPRHALDLFGVYGVAVFFAISGYLMSSMIQMQQPFEFILRRCLRIYPLFILATVAVMIAHPKIWAEYNLASMSIAPIGETKYPLGMIEWTLVYEVFFYVALFFVSLIGLRRHVPFIAFVWGITIIAAAFLGIQEIPMPTIVDLAFRPACIGLAGGLLIPWLNRIGTIPAVGIAVLSVIAAYVAPSLVLVRLFAGIGCVCLILAAVRLPDFLPSLAKMIFRKLGDWSYALYLIHIPILFVLYQPAFHNLGPNFLPARIGIAIIGGAILGQIDMVIHERVRKLSLKDYEWPVKAGSIAFLAIYLGICIAYI